MQVVITKINAIVHQLFYQHHAFYMLATESRVPTKAGLALTRNELHQYGLMVKQTKSNPKAILVLVDTNTASDRFDAAAIKAREAKVNPRIKHVRNRFLEFAQRELGQRLIILPAAAAHPATLKKEALELIMKGFENMHFAKKVEIEVTGQHRDWCVYFFRRRIRNVLRKQGKYVTTKVSKQSRTEKEIQAQYHQAREKKQTSFAKWRRTNAPKRRK